MTRSKLKLFICIGVLMFGLSLVANPTHGQGSPATGDPLVGLSADLLALFMDGKAQFERVEEIGSGLGPIFNGRSCSECHSIPASGGASAITVLRVGRLQDNQFDPLIELGGNVIQLAAIDPHCQERIPDQANVMTRRLTTPLFGAGLIESIPDEAIIARAARQPSAVRGRVNMVMDVATNQLRAGRFGWKSQQATLLAFSGEASQNEMGITNRLFPEENAPNGNRALLAECDKIADPEDRFDTKSGLFNIDKFANFMRFLGPPARGPVTSEVTAGDRIFDRIGCETCHTQNYTTGPNAIAALDRKPVRAFSDFLLHDVGPEGADSIVQGDAKGNELRTTPLWGLRDRSPHLHDGLAVTIEQSILLGHFGQGTDSRRQFENLSRADKDRVIVFLKSL